VGVVVDVNALELCTRLEGRHHEVGSFNDADQFAPSERTLLDETTKSANSLVRRT
jgi:hypothetical protein